MDKIIVALDMSNLARAKRLIKELWPRVKFFKIGLEMINTGQAPELIKYINKLGGKIFYDIKLNDIPNTVGRAAKVISRFGVWGFTVHGSSGMEAVRAAVENKGKTRVIGVTTLTSLKTPGRGVVRQAELLVEEGVDGIVCSAEDIRSLKEFKKFQSLKVIVPGIRPVWADKNDQRRSTTPKEAIMAGADYLVIGRPITSPPKKIGSSLRAVDAIIKEIS